MTKNVKNKTIKKKRALLIAFMIFALAVLAAVCIYETELNKLDSNNRVDNSFYDSQFKNKKIMVIVPHEDDDLLSVGQVLPQLYKNGADVRIVETAFQKILLSISITFATAPSLFERTI